MGKSFNDDIFNNSFNLDSINGLNISQEAINENKQAINLKINDDLSEAKKQFKKQQEIKQDDIKEIIEKNIKVAQEISEKAEDKAREIQEPQKDNTIYTKKTMIFNQEYLDIIDGLAQNKDFNIPDDGSTSAVYYVNNEYYSYSNAPGSYGVITDFNIKGC